MDPEVYDYISEMRKLYNLSIALPPLEALEDRYRISLDIVYTLTAIMAFFLNTFALTVILMTKKMSIEMKKYLSNLAIVDILIALSVPFVYTDFMYGRWLFTPVMCPIYNFISTTTVFVNIYTLVAIGIGRYVAIFYPFASLSWLETKTTQIIMVNWMIGMLIASPLLYQARALSFSYGDYTYYACKEEWEGQLPAKIYTIILFAIYFIIPLFLLAFLYGSIGFKMIRYKTPGNADPRRDETQTIRTYKLIKMLIILVSAFAICWFPIQLFNLIFWVFSDKRRYFSQEYYYAYTGTFFLCHWLSTAHSFINPIIYCVMSDNFKWKVIRKLFSRQKGRKTTLIRMPFRVNRFKTSLDKYQESDE